MEKFKSFVLSLIVLFAAGCNNDFESKIDIPEKVNESPVPKDKMIDVLVDIHLTDGFLSNVKKKDFDRVIKKRFKVVKTDSIYKSLYGSVFKKNGITQVQFFKALEYYSFHQQEYLNLYDKVIDILNAKRDSMLNVIRKK